MDHFCVIYIFLCNVSFNLSRHIYRSTVPKLARTEQGWYRECWVCAKGDVHSRPPNAWPRVALKRSHACSLPTSTIKQAIIGPVISDDLPDTEQGGGEETSCVSTPAVEEDLQPGRAPAQGYQGGHTST